MANSYVLIIAFLAFGACRSVEGVEDAESACEASGCSEEEVARLEQAEAGAASVQLLQRKLRLEVLKATDPHVPAVAERPRGLPHDARSLLQRGFLGETLRSLPLVGRLVLLAEQAGADAGVLDQPPRAQNSTDGTSGGPQYLGRSLTSLLWGAGCAFVYLTLCALIYNFCVLSQPGAQDTRQEATRTDGFEQGLCDTKDCCGQDCLLCYCSLCFPEFRWSDTISKVKTIGLAFWTTVWFPILALSTSDLVLGIPVLALIIAATICRQRIRRAYALEEGGCTWVLDFLTWFFCSCCAAVQEARQVERYRPKIEP